MWQRRKEITDLSSKEIMNLLKTKPTLIGHTYTAKQFFETDYEYELTNRDIIGKPVIDNNNNISGWEDVKIIDMSDNQYKFLVYPYISKCNFYTVYMKTNRLHRE